MKKRKAYHVVPYLGGWRVKHGRGSMWDYCSENKKDAVDEARRDARLHQLLYKQLRQVVVHGKDGRIQAEWTYGRDPRNTRG